MGKQRRCYNGYHSYDYLGDKNILKFRLANQIGRVPEYLVPLTQIQEDRLDRIINNNPVVSLHDHFKILPENTDQVEDYYATGRICTGFEGVAASPLDAVIGNQSLKGTNWDEVVHELGMRSCDAMHSGLLFRADKVEDIYEAKRREKVAWFPMIEHASMIGDEIDRLDVLYGLGVKMMGLVFSESNSLGGGLIENCDGGLTFLGRKAVKRMNVLGMPIDLSHAGDRTSMEAIKESTKPVVISHAGARRLWRTKRMKPDDLIKACADKGGLFGIEAAPHTTMTHSHSEHNIEAVMEHFEYVKDLIGIDFVTFGPDTMYGDHVGLHRQTADSYGSDNVDETFTMVDYVKGFENPTEAWWNIPRWLIAHNYSDENIAKVIGGNTIRFLKETL